MSKLETSPQIASDAFIAKATTIIGDVHIGAASSIWFGTVIRGDIADIRIGARTNIQDNSVIHADAGYPCIIGDNVTVGHKCIVHGATVDKGAMIGMGAIVMNGAHIKEECLVAAGTLIPENKTYPPRSLIMGSPGRVKRELTDVEVQRLYASAQHYVSNGAEYKKHGHGRAES